MNLQPLNLPQPQRQDRPPAVIEVEVGSYFNGVLSLRLPADRARQVLAQRTTWRIDHLATRVIYSRQLTAVQAGRSAEPSAAPPLEAP